MSSTPPSQSPISQTHVRCTRCGYDLTATAIGGRCPECGLPATQSLQSIVLPTSGKAVASLVLGIISIPGSGCWGIVGFVCGVLAIVLWKEARADIAAGTRVGSSAGLAKAGLICGLVSVSLGALFLVLFVGTLAFASLV